MFFGGWKGAKSPFHNQWVEDMNKEIATKARDALLARMGNLALEIYDKQQLLESLRSQVRLITELLRVDNEPARTSENPEQD